MKREIEKQQQQRCHGAKKKFGRKKKSDRAAIVLDYYTVR